MSDEEFEYEYDDDGDYGSPQDGDEGGEDDLSVQIANAFYEADGTGLVVFSYILIVNGARAW